MDGPLGAPKMEKSLWWIFQRDYSSIKV